MWVKIEGEEEEGQGNGFVAVLEPPVLVRKEVGRRILDVVGWEVGRTVGSEEARRGKGFERDRGGLTTWFEDLIVSLCFCFGWRGGVSSRGLYRISFLFFFRSLRVRQA